MTQRIVIAGAAGFIGRALAARLASDGIPAVAVTRRPTRPEVDVPTVALGEISASTDWSPVLAGAQGVVHLAARAEAPPGSDTAWIDAEASAAASLATAAAAARLRQVVLVSSVKAHGEATRGEPFRAVEPLAPASPYGVAKARIEAAMIRALAGTDTALAIVRPPLVYGPGMRGGFLALLRLIRAAPTLPFASIANRRSYLYRDNLVDLLSRILRRPDPVHGSFLAADAVLSTPTLVRLVGKEFGRVPTLLPCPVWALRLSAGLLRQGEAMRRLTDSLEVDDAPTRRALSWEPPFSLEQGLGATCRWLEASRALN